MIIEHALLSVKPGSGEEFERSFKDAEQVIAGAAGFQFIDLLRGTDGTGTYLLIIAWETAGAVEGFRSSNLYSQWTGLTGPFLGEVQKSSDFELLSHYPGDA